MTGSTTGDVLLIVWVVIVLWAGYVFGTGFWDMWHHDWWRDKKGKRHDP